MGFNPDEYLKQPKVASENPSFNPDTYLKREKTTEFNPDTYLKDTSGVATAGINASQAMEGFRPFGKYKGSGVEQGVTGLTEAVKAIPGKYTEYRKQFKPIDYFSGKANATLALDTTKFIWGTIIRETEDVVNSLGKQDEQFKPIYESYKKGEMSPEAFGKLLDEHVLKNGMIIANKPVSMAAFASKNPVLFAAAKAMDYTTMVDIEGKDPKDAIADITVDSLIYGGIRIGDKIIKTVKGGLRGNRVNPRTGEPQIKIKFDPKKYDLVRVANKVDSGAYVTQDELNLYNAFREKLAEGTLTRTELLHKPWDGWFSTKSSTVPVSSQLKLNAQNDIVVHKTNQITQALDTTKINSAQDIVEQLKVRALAPVRAKLPYVEPVGAFTHVTDGEFSYIESPLIKTEALKWMYGVQAEWGEEATTRLSATLKPKVKTEIQALANQVYNSPEFQLSKQLDVDTNVQKLYRDPKTGDIKPRSFARDILMSFNNLDSLCCLLDNTDNYVDMLLSGKEPGKFVQHFGLTLHRKEEEFLIRQDAMYEQVRPITAQFPKDYDKKVEEYNGKKYSWNERMYYVRMAQDLENNEPALIASGITKPYDSIVIRQMLSATGLRFNPGGDMLPNNNLTPDQIRDQKVLADLDELGDRDFKPYSDAHRDVTGEELMARKHYIKKVYIPGQGVSQYDLMNTDLKAIATRYFDTKRGLNIDSTVARKENVNLVLNADLLKAIDSHVREVARYIVMAPTLKNMATQFNAIESKLASKWGSEMTKLTKDMITDSLLGPKGLVDPLSAWLESKVIPAFYGVALEETVAKVGLIQASSIFNAAERIGLKETLAKVPYVIENYKQVVEDIGNRYPTFKHTFQYISQEALYDLHPTDKIQTNAQKYIKFWGKPSVLMDRVTRASVILRAEELYWELHPDGNMQDMHTFAEYIQTTTQPMTEKRFRSEFVKKTALGKMWGVFGTQRENNIRDNMVALAQVTAGKMEFPRWTRRVFNTMVLPAFYITCIGELFIPKEKRSVKQFGTALGLSIFTQMPVVSMIASSLIYNDGKLSLPGFKPVELGTKSVKTILADKDYAMTRGLFFAIQAGLAVKGINIATPRNWAAFVHSVINLDPDYKLIFMSPEQAGKKLSPMAQREAEMKKRAKPSKEREKKMEREMDKRQNPPTVPGAIRSILGDPKYKGDRPQSNIRYKNPEGTPIESVARHEEFGSPKGEEFYPT